jgi:hypothetical protein
MRLGSQGNETVTCLPEAGGGALAIAGTAETAAVIAF